MNILNQSIIPHGQSAFPPKPSSKSQESFQKVQVAPFLFGSHSLRSSQLSLSNKIFLSSTNDSPPQEFTACTRTESDPSISTTLSQLLYNVESNITESDPLAPGLLGSLVDKENYEAIKDDAEEPGFICLNPNDTLVLAVFSAVELECKQKDQIARKMRRLTGFRNVRLESYVDPSLIAGFVICYGKDRSHIIDLSVKGQLAELAARIESIDHIEE
ncbi:PREDICTED: ATP synthase delta chain, chloroplastic-like [Nelumbo nucifera]|uniref:ATP synthase delta chain, chloroplastic-like n=1 Tax=Nelumbo nucifera TaxID=4432 RepID=A0A1U7ZGI8_NELNU|nr:PREDICTED: ATP synthase delta chain, chloroplastic-like [Nelumbo nucifera]